MARYNMFQSYLLRLKSQMLRQPISLQSIMLLCGLILCLGHLAIKTSWLTLLSDHSGPDVIELSQIQFLNEVPVTPGSLDEILTGRNPTAATINIKIANRWREGLYKTTKFDFATQLETALGGAGHYPPSFYVSENNLKGAKIAMFADLDTKVMHALERPRVFFFAMSGDWKAYLNDTLIGDGSRMERYITLRLPSPLPDRARITFVVSNGSRGRIGGLGMLHGLSIRSGVEAAWAVEMLPVQRVFPRYVTCALLLFFALTCVVLGFSLPKLNDLWALGFFCVTLVFALWTEEPYYWQAFDWNQGEGIFYRLYKTIGSVSVVIGATVLTLAFFRKKGALANVALGSVITWAVLIICIFVPDADKKVTADLREAIDTQVAIALCVTQILLMLWGWKTLLMTIKNPIGQRGEFKLFRRRLISAASYCIAMLAMVGIYGFSWPHLATTPGSEFFYIASLAPTTSLLLQFYLQMRRELEQKRKEAHAARLTQMLAHDVRKPFTILKSVLQNLRSKDTSATYEALVARHLPPIERAIATTDGLIRDVMELGVTQSPFCESADLKDLITQAVEQCIHGDLKTSINVVYKLNHEKKLFVDGRKIDRVFVNILDNAISAMRATGTIELQSREYASKNSGLSEIEVSIANNGPAISRNDLRYIFDEFYSAEKKGGTGLGLAIAKKIVEAHGGSIWCESKPGLGVTFKMTLPTLDLANALGKAKNSFSSPKSEAEFVLENPHLTKPMLALIEDNPFYREMWATKLWNVNLKTFESPEEFWKEVGHDPAFIDNLSCVITDFYFDNSPSTTGIDLAQKLRSLSLVPIILSSDSPSSPNSANQMLDTKIFVAHLSKEPLTWLELQSLLN